MELGLHRKDDQALARIGSTDRMRYIALSVDFRISSAFVSWQQEACVDYSTGNVVCDTDILALIDLIEIRPVISADGEGSLFDSSFGKHRAANDLTHHVTVDLDSIACLNANSYLAEVPEHVVLDHDAR